MKVEWRTAINKQIEKSALRIKSKLKLKARIKIDDRMKVAIGRGHPTCFDAATFTET